MNHFADILRQSGRALPTIFWCFASLYLLYHTVQGDRGLLAWLEKSAELKEQQQRLVNLEYQKDVLEDKVQRLKNENLDLDMLDERARYMLNYLRPGDRIILNQGG